MIITYLPERTGIHSCHSSYHSADFIIKEWFKVATLTSKVVVFPTPTVMYVSYSMNPFSNTTKPLVDVNETFNKFLYYSFVRPT